MLSQNIQSLVELTSHVLDVNFPETLFAWSVNFNINAAATCSLITRKQQMLRRIKTEGAKP